MLVVVIGLISLLAVGGGYYYTTQHSQAPAQQVQSGNNITTEDSGVPVFTQSGYYNVQIPDLGTVGVLLTDSEFLLGENDNWSGKLNVLYNEKVKDELAFGMAFVVKRDDCDLFEKKLGVEPGNFKMTDLAVNGYNYDVTSDVISETNNEQMKRFLKDLAWNDGDLCAVLIKFKNLNTETGEEFKDGDVLKFTVYWGGEPIFKVEAPIGLNLGHT